VHLSSGGANSTRSAVLSTFYSEAFGVDWDTRTAIAIIDAEQATDFRGKALAFSLDTGKKTLLDVPGPTQFGQWAFRSAEYVGGAVGKLYMGNYTTVLAVDLNTAAVKPVMETVNARPSRLYLDRTANIAGWPDTSFGSPVIRFCPTNITHNGTGSDLRTSAPVPVGWAAMALTGHQMFTVNADGSLWVSDFENGGTKQLAPANPLLVNATDMDVDHASALLYVGTAAGKLVRVPIASAAAPELVQQLPTAVQRVWVADDLTSCVA
jgi:hypothetical protein